MSVERLNPTYKEHPVFETPPSDTRLWRYMDFPRFVALLERRASFFSSIRRFSDRYEAWVPASLLAQVEARGEKFRRERRHWNLASYVNCWNEDAYESVALWNMYTSRSGGVAIRSSVGSILAALDPVGPGEPEDEFYIGRVRYVDYTTASIPADNAFWPLVHKRTPYQFEHEVRLVARPSRLIAAAQTIQPDNWPEALPDIAPPGYDIGVDPNVLIETVVVAPEAPGWLLDLVQTVSARYGLTAPVSQSDLDAEPV